ncbi:hypothetical protein CLOM_g21274 [Closterium sp. NIES-68]|nr:hypothetical protein CLOM_g21274 [Closterium sp. NIES-68]
MDPRPSLQDVKTLPSFLPSHLQLSSSSSSSSAEAPAVIVTWAEQCRVHFGRPIRRLHSDGGGSPPSSKSCSSPSSFLR